MSTEREGDMPPSSPFNPDTRPLPPGWKECFDPQHQVWFYQYNLASPPRRSYVHPCDAFAQRSSGSSAGRLSSEMSLAQQLYASARVQSSSPQRVSPKQIPVNSTTSAMDRTAGYAHIPSPQPQPRGEVTPVLEIRNSDRRSSTADSIAYAKQSERSTQLQAQPSSPSSEVLQSKSGSTSVSNPCNRAQNDVLPPAFSSPSSSPPPPVQPPEPPEWQQQEHEDANLNLNTPGSSLERRPTLPIYSPVAEEGLSYTLPDDVEESLVDGMGRVSIARAHATGAQVMGHGPMDNNPVPSVDVYDCPPPAFSELSMEGYPAPDPGPAVSPRHLPAITADVLSNVVPANAAPTRGAPSGTVIRGNARRVSGPRPSPAVASGPSSSAGPTPRALPSPMPRSVPLRSPSSVSSVSTSSLSPSAVFFSSSNSSAPQTAIATSVSRPPSESTAAAYARSLYASAVANAAHPAAPAQRTSAQRVPNPNGNGNANANAVAAQAIRHTTGSVIGRGQSPSAGVVAPSPRPIAHSVPQTQVQHLQAQAAALIASANTAVTEGAKTGVSPPLLPPRRSESVQSGPALQVERLSMDSDQSQMQTPMSTQAQLQARPYRYSTAVVPPVSTRSSSSTSSSSFLGTPASSSSSAYNSASSWTAKTKKKTGGFFGMSSEKHKEMKRLEAERRERERAAAERAAIERARIAEESGVVRRVPPPPPPAKPAVVVDNISSPPTHMLSNPYVAAVQGQPQVQAQNLPLQTMQSHPHIPQQQQHQNTTLVNVLSGINAGLAQVNGRLQAGMSAAANTIGNTAGSGTNDFTGNVPSDPGAGAGAGLYDVSAPALIGNTSSGVDLTTFTSGIDLSSLTTDGRIDLSGLTDLNGIDLSGFTSGTDLGSLSGLDLSSINLSAPGVDLTALSGVDLSALTGEVGNGGIDLSSLADGLDSDITGAGFGTDANGSGDLNVYGLDDPGIGTDENTNFDSGAYDAGTFDPSQFGVNDSGVGAFDTSVGVDPTYGSIGDPVGSLSTFDTPDPSAIMGSDGLATQDSTSGSGSSNLYQGYQNYQNDSFDRQVQIQGENQLNDQYDQYDQYGEQLQDQYEQLQEAQQNQAEELQHKIDEQEKLEDQMQHQQQQEIASLQHQPEEEAKHEQQMQQQIQHQLQEQVKLEQQVHQQSQQQNQTQDHTTAQLLAQQQKIQQQAYAKLEAQMRAQAKMQAEYLSKMQKQQMQIQQQVQQHLQSQGQTSQSDATAALLEHLKKMQEEQTQAMLKLAQMQPLTRSGGGNTGSATGTSVANEGTAQALIPASLVNSPSPSHGAGVTVPAPHSSASMSQNHAVGSSVSQVHAKPRGGAALPPGHSQQALQGLTQCIPVAGASQTQTHAVQAAHGKPVVGAVEASPHSQHIGNGAGQHYGGSSGTNPATSIPTAQARPNTGRPVPRVNAHVQTMQSQQHAQLLTLPNQAQTQQAQLIQLQRLRQLQQLRLLQQAQRQAQVASTLQPSPQVGLQTQAQVSQQLQLLQQQQQNTMSGSFSAGAQQELGRLAARAGVQLGGMLLGSVLTNNNNNN